jgi:ADP-heptose:LPS heptosyltransferase
MSVPHSCTDDELAAHIVAAVVGSHTWPRDAVDDLLARAILNEHSSRVFFRGVVEKICDSFDPEAARVYADLFAHVVARVLPGYSHHALLERYERVRRVRYYSGAPRRVCVLSRVTLGADVVVTSMMLQAAKQRFPHAEICFVGPAKNAALFEADTRVHAIATKYGRSAALVDRLRASASIRDVLASEDTLVIDPDSRLTQLGIVPVVDEGRYLFFESRAYGGSSAQPLSAIAAQWIKQSLGVTNVQPYIKPGLRLEAPSAITISLGVGENLEKRAGDELERKAVEKLVSLERPLLIDAGGGGEETQRVERLVRALGSPSHVTIHHGPFASFASSIMRSRLYFGYDSAGQHVAATSGVPLVSVFAGYASERTFARWYPTGPGPIHVIRGNDPDAVERTLSAITWVAEEAGLSWPGPRQVLP